MRNVFVFTYGILYALVVIVCLSIYRLLRPLVGGEFGTVLVVVLILALPITYLLLRFGLFRERKKPESNLHEEFRNELLTNGYTEKSLGIAEQVINEVREGKKVNYVYLKDFVVFSADYRNQTGDYQKALELLNMLDPKDVHSRSIRFIDRGTSLLLYLNVRMDAVCSLCDEAAARGIKNEAHELFDKEKTDPFVTMLDMIDYDYHLMSKEYDEAMAVTDRMIANTSAFAKEYVGKYYASAEVRKKLGMDAEAEEYMRKAWEFVKDKNPAIQQTYHMTRTRLGMDEQ